MISIKRLEQLRKVEARSTGLNLHGGICLKETLEEDCELNECFLKSKHDSLKIIVKR